MSALQFIVHDHVATLVFNRPEARNAINAEMTEGLEAALIAIEANREIRAVIVTGAGGAFCAGGDVRALNTDSDQVTPEERRFRFRRGHRTISLLANLDRPVIAAVDGPAFGAGFSLALLADMIIATPRARFCMAFARIGLIPDYGALYTLPRIVGIARAKELMLTGRELGAAEAQALGLVLELVEPDALMTRAETMAAAFADASALAMSLTKAALNASLGSSFTTMLDLEATGQGVAGASAYAKEAFRRFAAREPASFRWPVTPLAPVAPAAPSGGSVHPARQ